MFWVTLSLMFCVLVTEAVIPEYLPVNQAIIGRNEAIEKLL